MIASGLMRRADTAFGVVVLQAVKACVPRGGHSRRYLLNHFRFDHMLQVMLGSRGGRCDRTNPPPLVDHDPRLAGMHLLLARVVLPLAPSKPTPTMPSAWPDSSPPTSSHRSGCLHPTSANSALSSPIAANWSNSKPASKISCTWWLALVLSPTERLRLQRHAGEPPRGAGPRPLPKTPTAGLTTFAKLRDSAVGSSLGLGVKR